MSTPGRFGLTVLTLLLSCGTFNTSRAGTISFSGTRHESLPGSVLGARCGTVPTLIVSPTIGIATGTSNLGDFVPEQSACLHTPFPAAVTNGIFTWTFADGDTMSGTYSGLATRVIVSPTLRRLTLDETYIISGGTGLFAGATGSFSETGVGTSGNAMAFADYSFSGTITTVTPEPGTLMLLGTALAGLTFRPRRR